LQSLSSLTTGRGARTERRAGYPFGLKIKKEQLAKQLAKESRITPAAAADQVDRIVSDILKKVRKGEDASLPGLGTFRPGNGEELHFEHKLPETDVPHISKKGKH
jgi:hypothetical protein